MINILKKAVRAGGAELKKAFGTDLVQTSKGAIENFATQADYKSEEVILEIIRAELPEVNIHAEESGRLDKKSKYTVVIDPLDGTYNFYLGIPIFTSVLALVKGDETVAGVIYHPLLDRLYWAEKGKGAFCNDERLSVKKNNDFKQAVLTFTCGYRYPRPKVDSIQSTVHPAGVVRMMANWSPAYELCLLAHGKTDGKIVIGSEIYDFLAGQLIAQEAGAIVTNFGKDTDKNATFVISTPGIHDELVKVVRPLL